MRVYQSKNRRDRKQSSIAHATTASVRDYRSIYGDARSDPDGYARHMGGLQRSRALETFGFALVVWLVGILLLYGVGFVVAWVVRGFRPA
jgi:hypothetical protein